MNGSRIAPLALLALALACGEREHVGEFCEGRVSLRYAPGDYQLDVFPDDTFTAADPATPTGLRVRMRPWEEIDPGDGTEDFANIFEDLSTLDGFGTTADLTLRADGPLDPESLEGAVHLVDLASGEAVPVEIRVVAEHRDDPSSNVILIPRFPLRPATRYGVAVTNAARGEDGSCAATAPQMRALLSGTSTDPRHAPLFEPVTDLVAHLRAAGQVEGFWDLAVGTVFTTQSAHHASVAIAETIRGRTYAYTALGCTETALFRECQGSFESDDFRVDGRAVDDLMPAVQATRTQPVTVWLPLDAPGPYPAILFGHGLGSGREQGERLAELAAPEGFAVVGIDAVKHGEHPDQPSVAGPLGLITEFFGLSLDFDPPLDALKLRDNFRQSTYEKLQLVEILRSGLDAIGDGVADVSTDRLVYLGVSLGGIMSAELSALSPELSAVVPIVPGAKVADIIQHGADFSIIVDLMRGSATDGEVARFFPLLQTAIDAGDAGAWTRQMVAERLPGFDSATPDLLMQFVVDDTIVPNLTNVAFARGLGVPLLGDALVPLDGVAQRSDFPVAANLPGGATGGIFIYDLILRGDGTTGPATHSNVAANEVAIHQTFHFLETHLSAGTGEIVDPYRDLGIKP
jgi:pimeloyl-ACP methyl ester carboxylesterase